MVTKDKQWWTFEVLRLSTNYNGYNCSKYALNFKSPIITHKFNGCWGQPTANKIIGIKNLCKLPTETHGDLWRPSEFDLLMLPTTANKIIGIRNLCKPPAETFRIWFVNAHHHSQ